VLNSPGTLDADYRGELHVILANFGDEPIAVVRGMRIAYLAVMPTVRASISEVDIQDIGAKAPQKVKLKRGRGRPKASANKSKAEPTPALELSAPANDGPAAKARGAQS
jgi:hypothetical protein